MKRRAKFKVLSGFVQSGAFLAGICALLSPAYATCPDVELAGQAVETVSLFAGPMTVKIGDAPIMFAAEAYQPNGDLVSDGAVISFTIRGGDLPECLQATVEHGVAYATVPAGTKSGQVIVDAQIGGVNSSSQTLRITPGAPAPFQSRVLGCEAVTTCRVETDILQDRFGNRLPDGRMGKLVTRVKGEIWGVQTVEIVGGRVIADWGLAGVSPPFEGEILLDGMASPIAFSDPPSPRPQAPAP